MHKVPVQRTVHCATCLTAHDATESTYVTLEGSVEARFFTIHLGLLTESEYPLQVFCRRFQCVSGTTLLGEVLGGYDPDLDQITHKLLLEAIVDPLEMQPATLMADRGGFDVTNLAHAEQEMRVAEVAPPEPTEAQLALLAQFEAEDNTPMAL